MRMVLRLRTSAPPTRRAALCGLAAALIAPRAFAQAPGGPPPTAEEIAAALPLRTTGLEHIAMIVPDVGAAGRFYSKLFAPDGLHKEKEGDLRYYVSLGPRGYIAIGTRASPPPPFLDHFCALVEDYNPRAMAARLAQEGLPQGRFGIFPDPNGIGLQLLGVPAGLAASTEPATRIVNGDALVAPDGLAHVLLNVDDVEESLAFYAKFFTGAVTREEGGEGAPPRTWIAVAGTRLGLQPRPPLEPPRVEELGVRVAPFDHAALASDLRILGATVAPEDPRAPTVLRLRDPYGLGVALVPA